MFTEMQSKTQKQASVSLVCARESLATASSKLHLLAGNYKKAKTLSPPNCFEKNSETSLK